MTRKLLLTKICPNAWINNCRFIGCAQCNVKLNEWLDEYDKHVIEQYKADTNLKDTIRNIHDNVAQEMYCKGIDDFAAYIREKVLFEERWLVDCKSNNANTNIAFSSIMMFINSVAEELKKVEIQ